MCECVRVHVQVCECACEDDAGELGSPPTGRGLISTSPLNSNRASRCLNRCLARALAAFTACALPEGLGRCCLSRAPWNLCSWGTPAPDSATSRLQGLVSMAVTLPFPGEPWGKNRATQAMLSHTIVDTRLKAIYGAINSAAFPYS